jgi:hypothetical protein
MAAGAGFPPGRSANCRKILQSIAVVRAQVLARKPRNRSGARRQARQRLLDPSFPRKSVQPDPRTRLQWLDGREWLDTVSVEFTLLCAALSWLV